MNGIASRSEEYLLSHYKFFVNFVHVINPLLFTLIIWSHALQIRKLKSKDSCLKMLNVQYHHTEIFRLHTTFGCLNLTRIIDVEPDA